jgi:hypothetical protein
MNQNLAIAAYSVLTARSHVRRSRPDRPVCRSDAPALPAAVVCRGTKDSARELPAYMSISMRFALGERTMLETPILIVIIVLVIAAVVWLSLMGRWSCCDAQSLIGSIL